MFGKKFAINRSVGKSLTSSLDARSATMLMFFLLPVDGFDGNCVCGDHILADLWNDFVDPQIIGLELSLQPEIEVPAKTITKIATLKGLFDQYLVKQRTKRVLGQNVLHGAGLS